jgi:predicted RNase H-like HicB family nuclease
MDNRYGMIIQWSEEDNCYVVFFPDFTGFVNQPCTDGQTYAEAAMNGQEVLELLIEYFQDCNIPLPEPKLYPANPLQAA